MSVVGESEQEEAAEEMKEGCPMRRMVWSDDDDTMGKAKKHSAYHHLDPMNVCGHLIGELFFFW